MHKGPPCCTTLSLSREQLELQLEREQHDGAAREAALQKTLDAQQAKR